MHLRIGTRGSALALTQTGMVARSLEALGATTELVIITTTGDRIQDRPLAEVGGKGLFVKEIEDALLAGRVEIAVHSMKDMPAEMHPELRIGAVPKREDPRDVLIPWSTAIRSLSELPDGAVIGTTSLRRRIQLLALRPDLRFSDLRGNVDTRLRKVRAREGVDAIVLAAAGLNRLGVSVPEAILLSTEEMLPAIGQGALCIQARADAFELEALLIGLHDTHTGTCVSAERELQERLGGDCKTPIAGYAELDGHDVVVRGFYAHPSGTPVFRASLRSPAAYARRTGGALAEALLKQGAGVRS